MKQARGLRNNNPLNIIKSEKINWQGEVKPSTDPNFAQFETVWTAGSIEAAPHLLQQTWMQDDPTDHCPMGPGRSSGDCRLHQHGVQAHGTEPRPAAASDEGGDEGDVVRHRAGYGDDGVRTERESLSSNEDG